MISLAQAYGLAGQDQRGPDPLAPLDHLRIIYLWDNDSSGKAVQSLRGSFGDAIRYHTPRTSDRSSPGESAMSLTLSEELRALVALQLVPGLGPLRTRSLLDALASARAVLQASAGQLRQVPGIGDQRSSDSVTAVRTINVDAELALIEKHRVSLCVAGQDGYPVPLATIHAPPTVLYVRGTILPADALAVAIVGSRHCTDYGRRIATRLATDLARNGYVVV